MPLPAGMCQHGFTWAVVAEIVICKSVPLRGRAIRVVRTAVIPQASSLLTSATVGCKSAVVVTLTAGTIAKAVRSANRSKALAVQLGSFSGCQELGRLIGSFNCQSNKCLPWHFFQLPILAGRLLWPRASCCFWVALRDGVLPFARDQQA